MSNIYIMYMIDIYKVYVHANIKYTYIYIYI